MTSTAATPYQSLNKIPGQVGFIIISDDGAVLLSGGDLQNEERFAKTFWKMANLVRAPNMEPVKRITVQYDGHYYVMGCSNKKLVIVKRVCQPPPETAPV